MGKGSGRLKALVVPVCLAGALAVVLAVVLPACCPAAPRQQPAGSVTTASASPAWAAPMQRPGLPNLHKVSDQLYRGAQPTAEGFVELKKMGTKTVVNLRSGHSDAGLLGDTGLDYVSIPMQAWHPEEEDLVAFLRVVTDPSKTPVFVHCEHGADRTGELVAAYRVAVQGWTADDAIKEMTEGGFGFHDIWGGRIGGYLGELDYDSIRRQTGIGTEGVAGGAPPQGGK